MDAYCLHTLPNVITVITLDPLTHDVVSCLDKRYECVGQKMIGCKEEGRSRVNYIPFLLLKQTLYQNKCFQKHACTHANAFFSVEIIHEQKHKLKKSILKRLIINHFQSIYRTTTINA